ncbi:MAG TPA: galactokinase family protein [Spirochaetia bacterium]|nr:galactokinase family protein [Spirochaetia bacterium]
MSSVQSLLDSPHLLAESAAKVTETGNDRFGPLLARLRDEFGATPQSGLWLASAPGRTELSGNHTDHNNGKVLAASVHLDSIAAAIARDDGVIRIASEGFPTAEVSLAELEPQPAEAESTSALIRGVAAGFHRDGYRIGGFDATVSSTVLPGSGLSSSASFEVLIGVILDAMYNNDEVGTTRVAQIGQFAENRYFGKPSGLMDQVACATGGAVAIDFADPDEPKIERIDVSFEDAGLALLVVDTGANHADLTDEYAAIPADMRSIAATLGGGVLRDVRPEDFYAAVPVLRKTTGDRAVARAMHFYDENVRVERMVAALQRSAMEEYIALMADSGRSSGLYLQNCVPVSNPGEQGVVIALALTEHYFQSNGIRIGVDGSCRVHGGGFAGTIQVLLPTDHVEQFESYIAGHLGSNAVTRLSIRNSGAIAVEA